MKTGVTPQACIKAQEYISVKAAEFQMLSIAKPRCTVVGAEETRVSSVERRLLDPVLRDQGVAAAGSCMSVMQ